MILKLQLEHVISVYVLLNIVQYACGAEPVRFSKMIILRVDALSRHLVTVQNHTDLGQCIKQCRASPDCRGINYKVRAHMCRLYMYDGPVSDIIQTTKSAPGFVYWKKDDSVQTSQPSSGTHEQTEIVFCPVPERIGNIPKYGNMYTNGSKQAYRCFDHNENREYKQVIQCSHGTWAGLYHVCGYGDAKSFGMKRIIFKFVYKKVSQSDAYQGCQKESGNLLILDTEYKQSFLKNALPSGIGALFTVQLINVIHVRHAETSLQRGQIYQHIYTGCTLNVLLYAIPAISHLQRNKTSNITKERKDTFACVGRPIDTDGQWTDSNRMGNYDWKTKAGNPIDNDVFHILSPEYMKNSIVFGIKKCASIDDSWKLRPNDCEGHRSYVCEITL